MLLDIIDGALIVAGSSVRDLFHASFLPAQVRKERNRRSRWKNEGFGAGEVGDAKGEKMTEMESFNFFSCDSRSFFFFVFFYKNSLNLLSRSKHRPQQDDQQHEQHHRRKQHDAQHEPARALRLLGADELADAWFQSFFFDFERRGRGKGKVEVLKTLFSLSTLSVSTTLSSYRRPPSRPPPGC